MAMKIYDLRTEYLDRPLGIDAVQPRFSWKSSSDGKNMKQRSYRIIAFREQGEKEAIWDSGELESEQSIAVIWQGPKLHSCERIYWKVFVKLENEEGILEQAESSLTWFEMGMLQELDWIADWIEPEDEVEIDGRMPAPYLRKEFIVRPGLKSARIYQSAHGLYEFWLNGQRGTEDVFKPGYTTYHKRLQYQAYDITHLLSAGRNCLSVALGDGWWRGTTGGAYRNNFGYKVSYIGQILLEYEDGSREWIVSDETFKTSTGGIRECDMKEGELFDANLEPEGWKESGFDDTSWKFVHLETDQYARKDILISSNSVPVQEMETFHPKVIKTPNGDTVLNIGQNIAGYVKIRFRGLSKGQRIRLVHGEALDEEGNFTLKNLIVGKQEKRMQEIIYIAKGEDEEEYCPIFAVFGFQYVLIQGYDKEIEPGDFTAVAVYSALEECGDFTCSNPLINQLVSNSRWSQKGNFLDVPTDCPTRERNPWSGDSQIYANTATKFMNVYPFFEKWLGDMSLEQFKNGKIPITIPISTSFHHAEELKRRQSRIEMLPDDNIMKLVLKMTLGSMEEGAISDGSAGWGDTAVITPYVMYLAYGDRQILEKQYPCAKKWVDYVIHEARQKSEKYQHMPGYKESEDAEVVWDTDFHFGEWCEPDETEASPFLRLYQNPDYNTATMYYFYSAKLLSQMAGILGMKEDEKKYQDIAQKVKRVFNKYFIREDGSIKEGRQAPSIRALAFGLTDDDHKERVAAKLLEMIKENGYKLNTGFLATAHLLPVLAKQGFIEEAYRVLEQTESPGWLANVKAGATTILENWDGYENCKASFNHYSYGAVCSFLFEYTAGIRPDIDAPGYKHFTISPVPGGSLTQAKAEYESGYGKILSSWKKKDGKIEYEFMVPVNTTATICLPEDGGNTAEYHVGSGVWEFSEEWGAQKIEEEVPDEDI